MPHVLFANEEIVVELKEKIDNTSGEIEQINAEINRLNQELQVTVVEKNTLANKVKQIDTTRKLISNNISATEYKITRSELTIEELDLQINTNQNTARTKKKQIAAALKVLSERDNEPLIELFLRGERLSEGWQQINNLSSIQIALRDHVAKLTQTNVELVSQISQKRDEISSLASLKESLADKKRIEDNNRRMQANLLSATKQEESEYQKLLADQLKRKEEFESQLLRLEQELEFTLDPSKLPEDGVLSWPLDGKITVTQHFGDTSYSKKNTGLYNGNGHRGIDLRAAVGTPLKASASGIIIGVGDTDLNCRGASYGRWVLIKHTNGLATLYAHMDLIKAVAGQSVDRGQLIGYSGNTGFTTGPHLHFSVLVADAVSIKQLASKNKKCGIYTLPVSPLNGYLSPLVYLP
ncbi:MAG: peptidoglycan DD-metalloendopeptidase family protein [bacterium]|nr:peptidoglycan DD-metalloendopeptidase family protein [bacterium]